MIKKELQKIVQSSLKQLGIKKNLDIDLVDPPSEEMGDLAFGCFELSKELKKSPVDIAKNLAEILKDIEPENIEKIEAVGPYVNFSLTNNYFVNEIKDIIKKEDDWGRAKSLDNQVFLAEHTDPNLFKEFHIGHMMTNTIGESLGRLAKFAGANVKQVTFQGDVGLHVAKTLYGMMNKKNEMPSEDASVWERQEFLGKCYAWGERQYSKEGNEEIKKEIIKINKNVYSQKNAKQNVFYEIGKKWSLEYFDEIYKIVGSSFEHYFMESETFSEGLELVKKNIGKIFEESEGAIIFPGSRYGLHDRVFINSEGLPTYEAKDLGLFSKKWEKYNPDISLTVTSNEQKQYFQVVKKAAGMIEKDWEEKTIHLAHGTLRLKSGKMSSRTGDIIRAKKWIDDTTEAILEKMENKNKEVAQKIALAAIKYSILKVQAGRDITYNQEEALSFEGNSGPYLQYTYVRARSILRKVEEEVNINNLSAQTVPLVGKTILKFPETIEKTLNSFSVHHLATYLHQLSSEFNSFYAQTRILDTKNPNYSYNIALTQAVAQTIKNGLYVLGIEVVEKM